VDFSTFPFGTASIQLWPMMDFTSLVTQEAYQFLTQWPEEESRLTAVIRPFNLSVILLLLRVYSNTKNKMMKYLFKIYSDLDSYPCLKLGLCWLYGHNNTVSLWILQK